MMISTLQCAIDRLLQLYFDVARHFAHPENHPGKDHHGDHRHDAFKQFLFFLRKFTGGFVNEDTQAQAQRSGKQHANPHHTNPSASLGTLKIAGNQTDNQRGFKSFAQHNEKWNKHATHP